jgi:GntR family transcriptional regulator
MIQTKQAAFTEAMPPRIPLYKDVKQRLTVALERATWRHGEALPPEPALAARYDVSVGTLRKAVDELCAEGLLVRRQGSGTYVGSHTRDTMLARFFQVVDRDGGKRLPQSQLLSFARRRASAATAALLRLPRGAPVYEIDNLLSLDGLPLILDRIRLPQEVFPDLTAEIFAGRETTIYGLYQSRYGVTVVRTEESIVAALADAHACELLRLTTPAPVLRVVRTAYAWRDRPVDTRVRLVDTRRHHYRSVLGQR